ncbi:MAG: DUF4430 domain-containing protein [Clostridia bacterium]|nr:DUF4430 domain-containing protein [Clostridia bacterium]
MKMKKLILPLRLLLIAVLIAAVALTIASCGNGTGTGTQKATEAATETGTGTGTPETEAPVEVEKLEIGEGAKTITVNVKKDNTVYEITVKTDADNLEDALVSNELVNHAPEDYSEYGLFIKKLIVPTEGGSVEMEADADHFWSIEQNGEMLMTGASSTPVNDGETFDFVYTAANSAN